MTSDVPLYKRDPQAWAAHLAEGNATQARKRVSADALLRDEAGRILLVNPKYKPGWDIPGGMAEANEPPHLTVQRELREELNLTITPGPVLCIDWVSPHGPWDDLLAFIFDGGQLDIQQITALTIHDAELSAFEFCTPEHASQRLRPHVWRRLNAALTASHNGKTQYLHDGNPLP